MSVTPKSTSPSHQAEKRHLPTVVKMVADNKDGLAIAQQMQAVIAALEKAKQLIIIDHIDHQCRVTPGSRRKCVRNSACSPRDHQVPEARRAEVHPRLVRLRPRTVTRRSWSCARDGRASPRPRRHQCQHPNQGIWAIRWWSSSSSPRRPFYSSWSCIFVKCGAASRHHHDLGDATTANPLWMAFVLARRKPYQTSLSCTVH